MRFCDWVEVASGDVAVYASGFRNPFALFVRRDGTVVAADNGPNITFGSKLSGVSADGEVEVLEEGAATEDSLFFGLPEARRCFRLAMLRALRGQSAGRSSTFHGPYALSRAHVRATGMRMPHSRGPTCSNLSSRAATRVTRTRRGAAPATCASASTSRRRRSSTTRPTPVRPTSSWSRPPAASPSTIPTPLVASGAPPPPPPSLSRAASGLGVAPPACLLACSLARTSQPGRLPRLQSSHLPPSTSRPSPPPPPRYCRALRRHVARRSVFPVPRPAGPLPHVDDVA